MINVKDGLRGGRGSPSVGKASFAFGATCFYTFDYLIFYTLCAYAFHRRDACIARRGANHSVDPGRDPYGGKLRPGRTKAMTGSVL